MLCSELHCRKDFELILFSCNILASKFHATSDWILIKLESVVAHLFLSDLDPPQPAASAPPLGNAGASYLNVGLHGLVPGLGRDSEISEKPWPRLRKLLHQRHWYRVLVLNWVFTRSWVAGIVHGIVSHRIWLIIVKDQFMILWGSRPSKTI